MRHIKVFSSAVRSNVGSVFSLPMPQGYSTVLGLCVSAKEKVEVTIELSPEHRLLHKADFCGRELAGGLLLGAGGADERKTPNAMHRFFYPIPENARIKGTVKGISAVFSNAVDAGRIHTASIPVTITLLVE